MIDGLTLQPILPPWLLAGAAAVALVLLGWALFQGGRGVWLRALSFLVLFVVLFDPRLVREERTPRQDVALVVVDDSPSQRTPQRQALTAQALAAVQAQLARFKGVDTASSVPPPTAVVVRPACLGPLNMRCRKTPPVGWPGCC